MEYTEIGNTFIFNDEEFIVKEDKPWPNCSCDNCHFVDNCLDLTQLCTDSKRKDNKSVYFEKVK